MNLIWCAPHWTSTDELIIKQAWVKAVVTTIHCCYNTFILILNFLMIFKIGNIDFMKFHTLSEKLYDSFLAKKECPERVRRKLSKSISCNLSEIIIGPNVQKNKT